VIHDAHNGPFYKAGQDASAEYKCVVRVFPIGRPIDFATWALIIELLDDAVEMLDAVVSSPEIGGIATEILAQRKRVWKRCSVNSFGRPRPTSMSAMPLRVFTGCVTHR
jgi:hypothetical protein